MAALTPWALCSSAMPAPWCWLATPLALGWGAAQAWRYGHLPALSIVVPPGQDLAQVAGEPVQDLQLSDRGVLLQLAWRCHGRRHWRLFWPDTLAPAQRRELRLAVRAHCISRSRPAVAP